MTSGFAGWVAAMAIFPTPVDGPALALECRVTGVERLDPALSAEQVCDRLARQMSEGLNRPVAPAVPGAAGDPAHTVRIDLRLDPRLGAIAIVEAQRDGKWLKSPELSVTSMDRPPNSSTIDQLGRDIADYMSYD